MKNICILGSTGSIGAQTLDVIRRGDCFSVKALSANKNFGLLMEQIDEFRPEAVCLTDENSYNIVLERYKDKGIKVLYGSCGLEELASAEYVDLVVNALVGNAGILSTLKAIEAQKDVALANKETLVSAGELIQARLTESKSSLLPVDSEHSAIFQCLQGNEGNKIKRIYLTASGGPFRNVPAAELKNMKAADALKHPNWLMGKKITVDSATLMNKALEVIEAKYLFGVELSQIEVLVHPQSIIHSMVEFEDMSVMAQLGRPDMRIPISYALNYPLRGTYDFDSLDFYKLAGLSFEKPRYEDFPAFSLAIEGAKIGGTMPAMINAANEQAVYKFLDGKIKFTDIPVIIEKAMAAYKTVYGYNIEDIIHADGFGRDFVSRGVIK